MVGLVARSISINLLYIELTTPVQIQRNPGSLQY